MLIAARWVTVSLVEPVLIMGFVLQSLRVWVGVVGAVALLNAVQSYWDERLPARYIYTLQPSQGDYYKCLKSL